MRNNNSSPAVTNCTFSGNSADDGGGMYNSGNSPTLTNCTFSGNSANYDGGGMYNYYTSPTVSNCTFSGNSAYYGGGIYSENSGSPSLVNCILWGNSNNWGTDESAQIIGGAPNVNYCCVQGLTGGLGGVGNIGNDPLFVDADGADDIVGTEDDDLRLSAGSPAIDAGDPDFVPEPGETDLGGHLRVLCGRVDMGAYEFAGDYDCDRRVDLKDIAGLQLCYTGSAGRSYDPGCEALDLDADNDIDLADLAALHTVLTGPVG